jgi:hypothetical protein
MSVTIPCAACSASVELGSQACPACQRPLSSEEVAALEARFEATSVDFRDAKTAFTKALAAALAAGLMTIAIQGMRVLAVSSDAELAPSFAWGSAAALAAGIALVGCWFAKRRTPMLAVVVAASIWCMSLVLPFVLTPVEAVLGMTSAAGVATTLARIVVLFMLVRGVQASTQMRHLLLSRGS